MSGEGRNGGNLHNVHVGQHWRLQTLRSPYMCPLFEADGEKFNPPKSTIMTIDHTHFKDGQLNDDCCYTDVEILEVDHEVVKCKTLPDERDPLSYAIFEVLNDDTIVRFYGRSK